MGTTKGLLPAPDGSGRTLVERMVAEIRVVAPDAPLFLVGRREEYAGMKLPFLDDEEPQRGPLSGLVALLAEGARRGSNTALCVACDHPYLGTDLLRRLMVESPNAAILCPFLDDRYQPLVARYDVSLLGEFRRALCDGNGSLQPLLRQHGATQMELNDEERASLRDWDEPSDRLT